MSVSLKIIGAAALAKAMEARKNKLQKMRQTNGRAAVEVVKWLAKNFESEGQLATGTKWKPLSPATIARRRKMSSTILQDTGTLKKEWKIEYNEDMASVTSNAKTKDGQPYGIAHEEGIGVPKRKILPTEKQLEPILFKVYGKHVSTSLK